MDLYLRLLCFCISAVAILFVPCCSQTLYTGNVPVVQLDAGNYQSTLKNSDTAWVVEFYAQWCGHCQRFAPVYKQFANDVSDWDGVVRVAALACSDQKNRAICRAHNIRTYPTAKFFPPGLASVTGINGLRYNSLHFDASSVRSATMQFIEGHVTASESRPSLKRFSNLAALRSSASGHTPRHVLGIIEEDSSTNNDMSKLIILDASRHRPDLVVGRVPRSAVPGTSLQGQELPALVSVHGDSVRYISKIENRADAKRLIQTVTSGSAGPHHVGTHTGDSQHQDPTSQYRAPHHHVKGYRPPGTSSSSSTTTAVRTARPIATRPTTPSTTRTTTTTRTTSPTTAASGRQYATGVTQEDLDANVYYSLWNEVPNRSNIRGKALAALKAYIATLAKYHPGNDRLVSFIGNVHSWIQRIGGSFRSEVFLNTIDGLQTNNSHVVKDSKWRTCSGSQYRYRGYPCSLWMTFHSMTVAAYEEHLKDPSTRFDPIDIINVIRKYVKYFFGCRDCANHFLTMSRRVYREVTKPQDGVLWLWKAHNKVNNRLHGDQTEDPSHPKVQFPSTEACPACRVDNRQPNDRYDNDTTWSETEVLNFLRQFYSPVSSQSGGSRQVAEWTSPVPPHTTRTTTTTTQRAGPLANGTCVHTQTAWGTCSASCDVGVATRFSNVNDLCEMRMEMLICQIRPCAARSRNTRSCRANEQEPTPKPLTFNNCTTTENFRWRYCGLCPGSCCEPVVSESTWAEMTCDDGSRGKGHVQLIKRCSCHQC